VDDSTLNPDATPLEPEPAEPAPSAFEPGPAEPTPAPGGGVGRAATLVGLGVLMGLGAGWLLFREEPGTARAGGESGVTEAHGIDVTNDPVLGADDAPITIVEFSDFDCPFCSRFASQTAPVLRRNYGDRVRWIFVNLPLTSIHPRAYDAALGGECAHEQDMFWEWYDAMFSGQFDSSRDGLRDAARHIGLEGDRFAQCLDEADFASEVAADLREAQKYYILGTPTFYINDYRLEGAQPPEAFAAVIDSILSGS